MKGEQEELQRPGSNGGGPRRIRKISPQQRQDRKFQIKKDTKHRPAHTQHTQELNELQIAQHLHHLTTTHLQPSGTCFSLTRRFFTTSHFSVTCAAVNVGLHKDTMEISPWGAYNLMET